MIKASELRIGNWFYDGFVDKYGNLVPATVKAITEIIKPDTFLEPIPLTPEILKACGFSKGGIIHKIESNIKISCGHGVAYIGDSFSTSGTEIKNIEYLHQLQNLYFALTGEELNVNLNVESSI